MYSVNSLVPKFFAQYCARNNKHLIQASGTLVNGIHSFYDHKTTLKPINDYGKTKLKGEQFIIKSKCNYSIIRFPGIYGNKGPSHLGINVFIKKALKKNFLTFSGNLNSKRNYVFVKDAAKAIMFCLNKRKFGIFYISGETQTFKSMLKKISLILGGGRAIQYIKNNDLKIDQIVKGSKYFKTTSFANSLKFIK